MGTVNCTFGITGNLLQDCLSRPISGAEGLAYAFNRKDVYEGTGSFTLDAQNPNKVTDLSLNATKLAYKIGGFKKEIDAGHDLVVSDTSPDKYNQYFKFEPWQISAEATQKLDNLADVVIVVERRNKGVAGDGAFIILGLETGLYKSSDNMRLNDADGKRIIELTNLDEQESTVSNHVLDAGGYAATKALLEGLLELPA